MLKILHIVYDLMRGGTEGQCARTAMACAKLGFSQRIAVFRKSGYFLKDVEAVCGPIYEISIRRMLSVQTFREIRRLKRHIQSECIDLVHTWDMDAGIFGSLAARWAGVPYITSRRNLAETMPRYKRILLKLADHFAAAVLVNAAAVRNHFVERGLDPSKVRVIPNMLDLDEFDRQASQAVSLPAGRLIGMVCRLEPEKCVHALLEVAPRLLRDFGDLKFIIVGEGSERRRLQALASELQVDHAVHFTGERTDAPALIRQFQIGVLTPSKNEGLSNSILEYMAAGIPVVATDCGGNAELLAGADAGLIVPPGDPASLAEAVAELLNNREKAVEMGARGRRKIEREHGPESVARQFLELYESVLTGRGENTPET